MVAKSAKSKGNLPISRHPLFPLMVALWFAALFGLGSLAIRPTLLESFVLALRLDLVVSAAAPPLGFTFRILLALVMFVAGGALGFFLARRIARGAVPKPQGRSFVSPKASSTAQGEGPEDDDFARLDSARASQAQSAQPMPGRRRALAMEEDFTTDHHDLAPLPGGVPQILDLADLGPMSEFEAPEGEAEQVNEVATVSTHESPVTEPTDPEFDPWQRHVPPAPYEYEATESVTLAEPVDGQRPFAAPAQTFAAPQTVATPQVVEDLSFAPPAAFATPETFVAPDSTPAYVPPASFAAPHEVAAFAPPAAAELPAYAPDFAQRPSFAPPLAEPAPSFAVPAEAPEQQFVAPAAPVVGSEAPVEAETPALAEAPQAPAFGQVSGDAADRLVASPIGSLGVVQLAERLALAIARKRDGANADGPQVAQAAPPVPVASPLPPAFAAAPVPALAPPVEAEPVAAFAVPETAAPAQFAAPSPAFAAPVAQFAPPPAMPAALRPLSFDDADDESLDSLLPPRSFAMPQPASVEVEAAPPAACVEEPAPVELEPELHAEPEATETAEDGYASLIDIASPARPFVRIEEPEAESEAIEPVVVFPGQEARPAFAPPTAPLPFAVPATPVSDGAAADGFSRQFDAPQSPGAPLRMPTAPARAVDSQETERQLKAALATLQRMSGAA